MITVDEAARLAGTSRETVRRWVRDGRLSARRDGPRLLIDRDELEAALTPAGLALPVEWATTAAGTAQPPWVSYLRRSRTGAR